MSIPPVSFRALHCHSEPFTVIPSEARNLALPVQGKLREESRSDFSFHACRTQKARFLAALGMTALIGLLSFRCFSNTLDLKLALDLLRFLSD